MNEKKENKSKYLTKAHFDKESKEFVTKKYLDEKLSDYPTKKDLSHAFENAFKSHEEKITELFHHNMGIYREYVDDKFKIVEENFQMVNERLDRSIIDTQNILNNHERRITTLEA